MIDLLSISIVFHNNNTIKRIKIVLPMMISISAPSKNKELVRDIIIFTRVEKGTESLDQKSTNESSSKITTVFLCTLIGFVVQLSKTFFDFQSLISNSMKLSSKTLKQYILIWTRLKNLGKESGVYRE